jgi:hypothetical protein
MYRYPTQITGKHPGSFPGMPINRLSEDVVRLDGSRTAEVVLGMG